MLIKCPKCDAPFDIEKRGSVCPQCGTDTAKIKRKKRQKTQEEKEASKKQLLVCLFIIFIMVIVMVYYLIKVMVIMKAPEIRPGTYEPVISEMGTEIQLQFNQVKIVDCEVINDLEGYLPAGYSLLVISYESDLSPEESLEFDMDMYLLLETGEYIKALNENSVDAVLSNAGVELTGVTTHIKGTEGKAVFLVSDGTNRAMLALYDLTTILRIQYAGADPNADCVYHVPLEWEVAE